MCPLVRACDVTTPVSCLRLSLDMKVPQYPKINIRETLVSIVHRWLHCNCPASAPVYILETLLLRVGYVLDNILSVSSFRLASANASE